MIARGPAPFLDGHKRLLRLWWRWRSRPQRGGRPPTSPELIALIRRLSLEKPLWGAPRIHGELLKLGFTLAQSTVSKYMRPRHGRQTWALFPREHAAEIAAIDLFGVQTVLFERLYAFVVLGHGRRRLLHMAVTDHPTAAWLALQITEAFPWDTAPAILVRDNDGAFGLTFRKRVRAMGIRDRPIRPRSPWQNGHLERLIGSIRRECLDHHLILNAAHLRRVLRAYADYYNRDRPHLALDKDASEIRPVEGQGHIISTPVLGGLHHRYGRKRTV